MGPRDTGKVYGQARLGVGVGVFTPRSLGHLEFTALGARAEHPTWLLTESA